MTLYSQNIGWNIIFLYLSGIKQEINSRSQSVILFAENQYGSLVGQLEKNINPIIDIRSSSLGWKSKYDSPRHEWDPYFAITFFRKYRIMWMWNYITNDSNDNVRSMATWEALLDYLYCLLFLLLL